MSEAEALMTLTNNSERIVELLEYAVYMLAVSTSIGISMYIREIFKGRKRCLAK